MRFEMSRRNPFAMVVPSVAFVVIALSGCVSEIVDSASPQVETLIERAEQGDPASQYRMGLRYTNGQGVEQDYAQAAAWFGRAAKSGHTEAQYLAGISYYTGRGVGVDQARAVTLFEKAARQGHVRSFYQLGDAYSNARGVAKDLAWAVHWYERAAQAGHHGAMLSFGVLRAAGLGVQKDAVSALSWLELAARNKQPQASILRDRVAAKMSSSQIARARTQADQWQPQSPMKADGTANIRFVQYSLNRLGYKAGPEDGVQGSKTRNAIRAFQADTNLEPSGEVSELLIRTLRLRALKIPDS